MRELRYQPDSAAQRLAAGRSSTIGILVPVFGNLSSFERLRGIVQALALSGYDIAVAEVEGGPKREHEFRTMTARGRVDGTIVMSLVPTVDERALLAGSAVPVVLLDRADDEIPCVATDDREGGRLATRHLLALGHRRIGFIGDDSDRPDFTSSRDRRRGYEDALEGARIPVDPAIIAEGPNGREAADSLAETLLSRPDPPTAIFAASDVQALGVIAAARRRGLRVPEDLSIIGFDDIELAGHLGLTTVNQRLIASGETAARMMLELLSGSTPTTTRVRPQLAVVPRATTAPRNDELAVFRAG